MTKEPDSDYHASIQQVKSELDFGEGSGAWLSDTYSNHVQDETHPIRASRSLGMHLSVPIFLTIFPLCC